jgi:ABC-2 type transport system ATP-binding protein
MKQNRPIALALRGVSKRFDRPAVDALDLTVYGGEFYALVGPNGAGKTTTLRMVVGLLRPDAGSISIGGIDALADSVAAKQMTAWLSDEPMIYGAGARVDRLAWARAARARALRRIFQGHAAEGGAGRCAGARPEVDYS